MSEPEDFLSRWSRRKQQAAKEASQPVKEAEPAAADDKAAVADAKHPTEATSPKAEPEPIFDVSKLPSLDSIGPTTDVRIFMQPGVPAPLARAALRRAWSADPAIRDFIGLSENSWDFTKPETIAGFGPLLPIDDVKRMLAQVLKDDRAGEAEDEEAAAQQDVVSTTAQATSSKEAEIDGNSAATESVSEARTEPLVHCTNSDPVPPQNPPAVEAVPAGARRRHGGALPG